MLKICLYCGNQIKRPLRANGYPVSMGDYLKRKFCNIDCRTKYRRDNMDDKRYRSVKYNGEKRKLHRRIYEIYYRVKLPIDCVIHHIDGNIHNNDISNLMYFPDVGSHTKYHICEKRLNYHAKKTYSIRECWICKKIGNLDDIVIRKYECYHKKCWNKYNRQLRYKRKEVSEKIFILLHIH